MTCPRVLAVLTAINLALFGFQLVRNFTTVNAAEVPNVLRGRSLEIVDDQGRVRASIKLHAAETHKPTGKKYPETVMFRLIDGEGRPEVKLGASREGGGLGLIGEADDTQILLEAQGAAVQLKLRNEDGKQQVLKP